MEFSGWSIGTWEGRQQQARDLHRGGEGEKLADLFVIPRKLFPKSRTLGVGMGLGRDDWLGKKEE